MTYREQINLLLVECTVTANAYIDHVSIHGQYSLCNKQKTDWEQAEKTYDCWLRLIKTGLMGLDDTITELNTDKFNRAVAIA